MAKYLNSLINHQHIYQNAVYRHSPHFNQRPEKIAISLLVIHCISLPEGQFGLNHIDDLFLGCINCNAHPDFKDLAGLEVSAHILIRRDGQVIQYVPFDKRAWHAGVSEFNGVPNCNDFSIGIELEGCDNLAYEDIQYKTLAELTKEIQIRYPDITQQRIVGHSDIAPGRKTDPGKAFDWEHYFSLID
ncbi:1,6-anhydro-N-acetylmuramyl-L-alanine amidase AmpD [Catenovulum maritimum]|uniref:1,6-anhydro-N-acetylmuramyl-L-alanine amidase AmpD n=1 Tax=Catenovulum maritimum TaxID=1513271 RepID=UPI0009900BE9|nr:1,6-anhydro-N-acetylmuramyl-L-alanine amidase AmpD [Catenovulum maritimum]